MTLLDEWEHGDLGTLGGTGQSLAGVDPDDGLDDFPGSPTSAEPSICSLEVVDRQLARLRAAAYTRVVLFACPAAATGSLSCSDGTGRVDGLRPLLLAQNVSWW